jgi:hypothetical protein
LPQHEAFAGPTMAPAASEPSRYPRRRSRVYLFPDWPQVREPRPDGAPGSISSKSPQSPGFEPGCHGPAGPFSYEGRKNRTQNQRSGSRRRPRHCRSLEVTAFAVTAVVVALGMDHPASVSRTSLDGEVAGPGRQAWLGPLGPLSESVGTGFGGRVDLVASAAAVGGLSSTAFELLKDVLHRLVVADRVGNPAVVVVACDNDGTVG